MKCVLVILLTNIVSYKVTYAVCSYYGANSSEPWKCNEPLATITGLFVTDIPRSTITILNKDVLASFKALEHIHIGKCDIEVVSPNTFDGYNLKSLYMNDNKIKRIQKGTLNTLNKTTSFEMTFNQLESLEEDTFLGMVSLSWMSLSANKISKIDKNAFNGLVNLEVLFLASNQITTLDIDTFKPLQRINLLDVSHNHLANIEFGMFSHFPDLQMLLLEHNELKTLPNRVFDNLTALATLDVSQNQLSEIEEKLFGQVLENFFEFKIYSNKIRNFNAQNFFTRAPRIKQIELYDNPWNCMELEKLQSELLHKKVFIPIPVRVNDKPNVDGIACEQ